MTPDAYRAAISALGLSQIKAAKALGIADRTSRRWARGGVPARQVIWVRDRLSEIAAERIKIIEAMK